MLKVNQQWQSLLHILFEKSPLELHQKMEVFSETEREQLFTKHAEDLSTLQKMCESNANSFIEERIETEHMTLLSLVPRCSSVKDLWPEASLHLKDLSNWVKKHNINVAGAHDGFRFYLNVSYLLAALCDLQTAHTLTHSNGEERKGFEDNTYRKKKRPFAIEMRLEAVVVALCTRKAHWREDILIQLFENYHNVSAEGELLSALRYVLEQPMDLQGKETMLLGKAVFFEMHQFQENWDSLSTTEVLQGLTYVPEDPHLRFPHFVDADALAQSIRRRFNKSSTERRTLIKTLLTQLRMQSKPEKSKLWLKLITAVELTAQEKQELAPEFFCLLEAQTGNAVELALEHIKDNFEAFCSSIDAEKLQVKLVRLLSFSVAKTAKLAWSILKKELKKSEHKLSQEHFLDIAHSPHQSIAHDFRKMSAKLSHLQIPETTLSPEEADQLPPLSKYPSLPINSAPSGPDHTLYIEAVESSEVLAQALEKRVHQTPLWGELESVARSVLRHPITPRQKARLQKQLSPLIQWTQKTLTSPFPKDTFVDVHRLFLGTLVSIWLEDPVAISEAQWQYLNRHHPLLVHWAQGVMQALQAGQSFYWSQAEHEEGWISDQQVIVRCKTINYVPGTFEMHSFLQRLSRHPAPEVIFSERQTPDTWPDIYRQAMTLVFAEENKARQALDKMLTAPVSPEVILKKTFMGVESETVSTEQHQPWEQVANSSLKLALIAFQTRFQREQDPAAQNRWMSYRPVFFKLLYLQNTQLSADCLPEDAQNALWNLLTQHPSSTPTFLSPLFQAFKGFKGTFCVSLPYYLQFWALPMIEEKNHTPFWITHQRAQDYVLFRVSHSPSAAPLLFQAALINIAHRLQQKRLHKHDVYSAFLLLANFEQVTVSEAEQNILWQLLRQKHAVHRDRVWHILWPWIQRETHFAKDTLERIVHQEFRLAKGLNAFLHSLSTVANKGAEARAWLWLVLEQAFVHLQALPARQQRLVIHWGTRLLHTLILQQESHSLSPQAINSLVWITEQGQSDALKSSASDFLKSYT